MLNDHNVLDIMTSLACSAANMTVNNLNFVILGQTMGSLLLLAQVL